MGSGVEREGWRQKWEFCAPVSKIRFKEGTSSESLILLALENGPDCREDGVDLVPWSGLSFFYADIVGDGGVGDLAISSRCLALLVRFVCASIRKTIFFWIRFAILYSSPSCLSFVKNSSREVYFESETRRLNLKWGMREMRISMRFGASKAVSMQGNVERIHFQRFINAVCAWCRIIWPPFFLCPPPGGQVWFPQPVTS